MTEITPFEKRLKTLYIPPAPGVFYGGTLCPGAVFAPKSPCQGEGNLAFQGGEKVIDGERRVAYLYRCKCGWRKELETLLIRRENGKILIERVIARW